MKFLCGKLKKRKYEFIMGEQNIGVGFVRVPYDPGRKTAIPTVISVLPSFTLEERWK